MHSYLGRLAAAALFCAYLFGLSIPTAAQVGTSRKYPSLLWEITGNGLKKPSYLFGTMHVSDKLVFHLSDSFYYAIRAVDVVALELNPELWQTDIPRINQQNEAYQRFSAGYSDDYYTESSLTVQPLIPRIKSVLAREPEINNSLLYRTDRRSEDFEESTYLDLYIYQTGRKLGKKATGVEEYAQSQRMMVEAYLDAESEERKGRRSDYSAMDVYQALQDAYRAGDLDALDSLNALTNVSDAYTEKFLFKRNDIQARSMDSIMRRQSLFVGVGAAHLPGKRGVIEILRRKGYKLRPVIMQDRDAAQAEAIDSLRVPVAFGMQWADDSLYSLQAPGPLLPLEGNDIQRNYADMANGSYYLVSRLRTNPVYTGLKQKDVLRIVDSLLYESIPGRIITKTVIERSGHPGYDIVNRTRRGDVQRYQVFATPGELLIFKMGGKGAYVAGQEAETFFNSITFPEKSKKPLSYTPPWGDFSVQLPAEPFLSYTQRYDDGGPRTEIEAVDPKTGDVYTLVRKDMYSFSFLEADTFDATLMMESFLSSSGFEKPLSTKVFVEKGVSGQEALIRTKDGATVNARTFVGGAHGYLLAVRSAGNSAKAAEFFKSFTTVPRRTPTESTHIQDTFLHLDVESPVSLKLDADVAGLISYTRRSALRSSRKAGQYSSSPERRHGNFMDEASGEFIIVDLFRYPDYHFSKDSARFWKTERESVTGDSTMILRSEEPFRLDDGAYGYRYTIGDTGSSRVIKKIVMMKGPHLWYITTVVAEGAPLSPFVSSFFSTARPYRASASPSLFESRRTKFFADYYSKDSTVRKRARAAVNDIYFGAAAFKDIMAAIAALQPAEPDYYTIKSQWIKELGYLNDSTLGDKVSAALSRIYTAAGDTTTLQNAALGALARLRSTTSTNAFKKLLVNDPPVFDGNYEYDGLFKSFRDTLRLAATLFPEALSLAPIQDYKTAVISLLAKTVDSGYTKPAVYKSYVANLIFDAKILLKKQQVEDEQARQTRHKGKGNSRGLPNYSPDRRNVFDTSRSELFDYAVLLAPFYNELPAVGTFFDKLRSAGSPELRAQTALLLHRRGLEVPFEKLDTLARNASFRGRLYTLMDRAGLAKEFPAAYRSEQALVTSAVRFRLGTSADSLRFIQKRPVEIRGRKGSLYVFKYKGSEQDGWKMVLSGPYAAAADKRFGEDAIVWQSGREINGRIPLSQQIDKAVRAATIATHPGGRNFYSSSGSYGYELGEMMRSYRGRD